MPASERKIVARTNAHVCTHDAFGENRTSFRELECKIATFLKPPNAPQEGELIGEYAGEIVRDAELAGARECVHPPPCTLTWTSCVF